MESGDEHVQRVGRTLNDKWTLHALLGVGGAGAVYRATHRNGRSAAVKILHRELTASPEQVSRFLREGYIANQLAHPGVVEVLDDDVTEDGLVYLVLELLEGRSLDEELTLRGRKLPPPEAVAITDAVLDVLAVAHDKGIVHRDVKPENVFLPSAGGVKVLDFGIAKARGAPSATATQIGAVFGTPGFMPPEQARGRAELIDARTDVWAAGATLFLMVTGQRLHEATTTNESLLRAMVEEVPPSRSSAPSLPEDLARVLDRALAFDPAARWQDARSMQAALREVGAALYEPREPGARRSSRPSVNGFAPVEVHTPRRPTSLPAWPLARGRSAGARLAVTALGTAVLGAILGVIALSSLASVRPAPQPVVAPPPTLELELTDADIAPPAGPSPAATTSAAPATRPAPSAPPRPAPQRPRKEDVLRNRR